MVGEHFKAAAVVSHHIGVSIVEDLKINRARGTNLGGASSSIVILLLMRPHISLLLEGLLLLLLLLLLLMLTVRVELLIGRPASLWLLLGGSVWGIGNCRGQIQRRRSVSLQIQG